MKFLLFSKISFNVSNPIALIESFCFQSNFYSNYDLKNERKIEYVNRIGARIERDSLRRCKSIISKRSNLSIFRHKLDGFLKLTERTRNNYIEELCEKVVKKLANINGIGFSKTTKILHTLHPDLIPMIDNPLQELYRKKINLHWTEQQASQIFIDYYENLKLEVNWKNLDKIYDVILKNKIPSLSKVRLFDILWWSFLKAKKLKDEKNINWSSIKWKV